MSDSRQLKYGTNPHQKSARLLMKEGDFPFKVVNGEPGYINMLDALNAWQLVRELRTSLSRPAAASFKHVSPAGAAVGRALSPLDKRALLLPEEADPNPLSCALLRARGADPVSSFGDFIALSDVVDAETASLLVREVSDGIIAPGYEPEAQAILAAKRKGSFLMLEIDPNYEPGVAEQRELFGITFEQDRNRALIDRSTLGEAVTQNKELPEGAAEDAVVGLIALKYTQSNSIAFAWEGQAIGIGAGQQSRIHCTRIAADKAETWLLRRHPVFAGAEFAPELSRTAKYNAVDMCIRYDSLTEPEKEMLSTNFSGDVPRLSPEQRQGWIRQHADLVYASDAFIPFRDNLDRAAATGARYVVQPGGSARDAEVIQAADEYQMAMFFTGLRLFTH